VKCLNNFIAGACGLVYCACNTDGDIAMKKLIMLLPLLALSACGYSAIDAAEDVSKAVKGDFDNGIAISESITKTQPFEKLSAVGPDNVIFNVGESFQISASGDADAIKKIRYIIEDGTIKIGRINGKWSGYDKGATIRVTAPALSMISLAGSGDVTADRVSSDNASFSVAGSGDLTVGSVTSKSAELSVAGSGNMKISGKSDKASYSVAGSGDIDASNLSSVDVDISLAGSGNVNVLATGEVSASIVGSGDVTVTGGAKCESSKVGSGELLCS
jgi:Putative auto-transporter adhesin, head GIN domain